MASKDEKKEEATIVSKETAPVLLAFLSGWYDIVCFKQYKSFALMPTGNTVNMLTQIGNSDYTNTKFFALAIANYCGGMYIFKFLDLKMQGLTNTTAAKLIFGLHAASDQLRIAFPESRFTVLPLTISGGFFNALSAGKLGGIMAMMHGQYQGLMATVATATVKGNSEATTAAMMKSLKVIVAFCFGLFAGAYGGNMNHPFSAITNRRFSFIGALYAAILVLSEKKLGN